MNKLFNLGAMLTIAAGAMMINSSCSSHDIEYNGGEIVKADYEAAFVKTFGTPAANQDWGFGSRTLPSSFGKTTRAARPEGNQWADWGYTIPSPITKDELNDVLAVFNQKGEASYESLIDWDCYFVQQVYKGVAEYTSAAGGEAFVGSDKMNHLFTVTNKHINNNSWPVEITIGEDYNDHIFNFNNGTCKDWNGIMLMENTNSNIFGFNGTEDSKVIYYNFRMEKINGNYYVGFDFEGSGASGTNQDVKRDYIYNDWIVKIVPGKGNTPSTDPDPKVYKARIICEDLSANTGSDFDFNDVVFDVEYRESINKTFVTIQAAGGTLPLYVAGKEVHQLFAEANSDKNITTGTMINTNASNGISGLAPVSFTIDGVINPSDIEVAVSKEGNLVPLAAEIGKAASKIAVDPDFEWCNEREDITSRYSNFASYVKDTKANWYK